MVQLLQKKFTLKMLTRHMSQVRFKGRKLSWLKQGILFTACFLSTMAFLIKYKPEETNVYLRRNQQIKETCKKHGIPVRYSGAIEENMRELNMYQKQWLEYEQKKKAVGEKIPLLHNEDNSLCYCWTRKVASTSWKMLFYKLVGKTAKPNKAHMADTQFMVKETELNRILADNSTLRFFFARHPFDRLVSVYVQKFELGHKHDWTYKTFTPKILKANGYKGTTDRPTLKQFITYILQLTNMASFNDHWRPQWLHCNVCQWSFQVPGHIETLKEDSRFILQRAKVNLTLPWNNISKNQVHRQARSHIGDTKFQSSTMAYLKELEKDQIKSLHELYLLDFEMFGYSPYVYYD